MPDLPRIGSTTCPLVSISSILYAFYKIHPVVDEDFLVIGLRLDRIGREKERKDEEMNWNNGKKEEYTEDI